MNDLWRLASVPSFYMRSEMESGSHFRLLTKRERERERERERGGGRKGGRGRERKREKGKGREKGRVVEIREVRVPYYISISIDCN